MIASLKSEHSALGSLVVNLFEFLKNGLRPDTMITDWVNSDQQVAAALYFIEFDRRFVIRQPHLPFDPAVKGAFINKFGKDARRPCLELAPIDFSELKTVLEADLPEGELKGRAIFVKDGTKLIESKTMARWLGQRSARRTTIVILPHFNSEHVRTVIKILDLIYNNGIFIEDPKLQKVIESAVNPVAETPQMTTELRLEMQTIMNMEQRLSMSMRQKQLLIPSLEILQLSRQELETRLERMQDELVKLHTIMRRRAIARIMRIKPSLTVQQAVRILDAFGRKSD